MYVVLTYNRLVSLRNRVRDQWAQIDVQLKKRADLIPNLVETVKGYAAHEKETFEEVIAARNRLASANNPEAEIEANNALTHTLSKLFALAEAYPELKANENFLSLQADQKILKIKLLMQDNFIMIVSTLIIIRLKCFHLISLLQCLILKNQNSLKLMKKNLKLQPLNFNKRLTSVSLFLKGH